MFINFPQAKASGNSAKTSGNSAKASGNSAKASGNSKARGKFNSIIIINQAIPGFNYLNRLHQLTPAFPV